MKTLGSVLASTAWWSRKPLGRFHCLGVGASFRPHPTVFVRTCCANQISRASASYLTARPSFRNAGPMPRTRHCCRVRKLMPSSAAASRSLSRRRMGEIGVCIGVSSWPQNDPVVLCVRGVNRPRVFRWNVLAFASEGDAIGHESRVDERTPGKTIRAQGRRQGATVNWRSTVLLRLAIATFPCWRPGMKAVYGDGF